MDIARLGSRSPDFFFCCGYFAYAARNEGVKLLPTQGGGRFLSAALREGPRLFVHAASRFPAPLSAAQLPASVFRVRVKENITFNAFQQERKIPAGRLADSGHHQTEMGVSLQTFRITETRDFLF